MTFLLLAADPLARGGLGGDLEGTLHEGPQWFPLPPPPGMGRHQFLLAESSREGGGSSGNRIPKDGPRDPALDPPTRPRNFCQKTDPHGTAGMDPLRSTPPGLFRGGFGVDLRGTLHEDPPKASPPAPPGPGLPSSYEPSCPGKEVDPPGTVSRRTVPEIPPSIPQPGLGTPTTQPSWLWPLQPSEVGRTYHDPHGHGRNNPPGIAGSTQPSWSWPLWSNSRIHTTLMVVAAMVPGVAGLIITLMVMANPHGWSFTTLMVMADPHGRTCHDPHGRGRTTL